MQDAQGQVEALKLELGDDPGAGTRRVRATRQRAAAEREQRIEHALKAMGEIDKNLSGKGKKRPADSTPSDTTRQDEAAQPRAAAPSQPVAEQPTEQPNSDIEQADIKPAGKPKKPKEPRVSTTDHEARVMKMADGGFRPAFNAQLAVDTATLIITSVDLINSGSDMNQMLAMQ